MSRDLAEGLLARARDDAATVRAVLTITGVSDAIVGFHAQQAVEKSIKAVLAANDHPFPFTHDLEGLIERCHDVGVELPELVQHDAGLLTPYAVRHRYGHRSAGGPGLGSQRVRSLAIRRATTR